jgi:sulfatase maturation enzyme AslB (radical SAM superfamily)
MMVKHLDKFLEKLDSCVELRFNTNGTVLNPKVYNQLKRFNHVNMCVSIDGLGKVNDYIRWGSTWNEIEYNVYKLAELSNVSVSIGPTIQIMNALYYDKLSDWAGSNQFTVYDNMLMNPAHLNLTNADEIIKQQTPRFSNWHNVDIDIAQRDKFIKYVNILDSSRSCSIKDYLPEIASIYGIN